MRAGRFACVALPIILTIAAIVALLIGVLSGVAHNRLYIFRVDLTDLSIDPANVKNIIDNLDIDLPDNLPTDLPDLPNIPDFGKRQQTSNITAADLGLADEYDINLWGFCAINQDGKKNCTDAEYDWAANYFTGDVIDDFGSGKGVQIELPKELKSALNAFSTVSKYAEIAFIVCLVALGIELILGIFATCTRVMSCLTWLIAIVAIILTIAACALTTAVGAIVVGAIEATAKFYGVRGDINTSFLATIWIGAAFSIAAGLFWLFTLCCCKPEHGRRDKRGSTDGEKLLPQEYSGGYAPVGGNNKDYYNNTDISGGAHNNAQYYNNNATYDTRGDYNWDPTSHSGSHSGASSHNPAYEPYSHRN